MYALATVPLLTKVSTKDNIQVWYADDAAAGGKLNILRQWWNKLNTFGSLATCLCEEVMGDS